MVEIPNGSSLPQTCLECGAAWAEWRTPDGNAAALLLVCTGRHTASFTLTEAESIRFRLSAHADELRAELDRLRFQLAHSDLSADSPTNGTSRAIATPRTRRLRSSMFALLVVVVAAFSASTAFTGNRLARAILVGATASAGPVALYLALRRGDQN